MFCFRFTPALLLLTAATTLPAQTDTLLSRFVQPNAKALIGIDWKHIRQSGVGATLTEKWLSSDAAMKAGIPGLEFVNDIDRIVISSPGGKSTAEKTTTGTVDDTPVLIVASGHFDLEKLRTVLATFGAKPQMFNSIPVYRPQGNQGQDMAVVLLDAQTILIGDAPSVFNSLEHNAFSAPVAGGNPILAHAAEMEATYDAWMILNDPEELGNSHLTDLFTQEKLGGPVKQVQAGLSLRAGLAAEIELGFDNPAAATKLTVELDKLLKMVSIRKTGGPNLADVSKNLKIVAQANAVKISLRLSPQELEKNTQILASLQTKRAADDAVAHAQPVARPTPQPMPEQRKTVRIEGLDDGPREIPYQQQ